jgi:putative nucleotidyltransferase with HDIG domain
MLSKDEALGLLDEYVMSAEKRQHILVVSAIMKELAVKLGFDEHEWELVGLLHDLDYDIIKGDLSKHGLVAAEMLHDRIPERCLHAIRSHDYRAGVKPESVLDKALIVSDCVWFLTKHIGSSVLSKANAHVGVKMLKSALDSASFPSYLKNGIMLCNDFDLNQEELFRIVLKIMCKR